MQNDKLAQLRLGFDGATQAYKAKLRALVDAGTVVDVQRTANQILEGLPKDMPLGTLTAALMLAATAYAEGATSARVLIEASEK